MYHFSILFLIELRACRDVRIDHQKIELFFALFLMNGTQQHAVGLHAHHGSRREVHDGDQRLSDELLRLIEGVNSAKITLF